MQKNLNLQGKRSIVHDSFKMWELAWGWEEIREIEG